MAGLKPHVPRIYRIAATGLGASMWFFLFYRAKKDGTIITNIIRPPLNSTNSRLQDRFSSAGSTLGITERATKLGWLGTALRKNCTYGHTVFIGASDTPFS
ncbi:hypothetical protein QBC46DRAFT_372614 [Diplogelasinospora grovesii]|uniref:Uncharacterized protein n=1 Tax=Diplogelasinospora grovesii TaxID=303347 RepID=A0AAN6S9J2_9PEZI|nr:hypothetical protein QBC46DRAFT_372614 [Diplogelasinospora grovesii]